MIFSLLPPKPTDHRLLPPSNTHKRNPLLQPPYPSQLLPCREILAEAIIRYYHGRAVRVLLEVLQGLPLDHLQGVQFPLAVNETYHTVTYHIVRMCLYLPISTDQRPDPAISPGGIHGTYGHM